MTAAVIEPLAVIPGLRQIDPLNGYLDPGGHWEVFFYGRSMVRNKAFLGSEERWGRKSIDHKSAQRSDSKSGMKIEQKKK